MELVFNRDPKNNMQPKTDLILYTFNAGEYNAVETIFNSFKRFIPISLPIAVLLLGYLMMAGATNSNNRLTYRDYIAGIIIFFLLIEFGHYL